jgi:membrane-associated HD superfamily phosphohydrolase
VARAGPTGTVVIGAVVGALLGLAAGVLLLTLASGAVRSEASVLVLPTIALQDVAVAGESAELSMDTEAQVARSVQVAEAVKRSTDSAASTDTLLRSVRAFVQPNSQVMTITFDADNAETAREGAQAFAEEYLTVRADNARQAVDGALAALQSQVTSLEADLRRTNDELSNASLNSARRSLADAQRTIVISQINDANSQLLRLRAVTPNPGRVISTASTPVRRALPTVPVLLLASVIGAAVGAGIGMGWTRVRPILLGAVGTVPDGSTTPPPEPSRGGGSVPGNADTGRQPGLLDSR